ncbi:hypothetical protein HZH66_007065 [Vespula vulgaris]|uniref:Peptidase S1 domain-containing protein n=1 Tax=Vespula vulgaris TaxID=7454 RepID=A0A834JWY8_VESVU|nr:hypothetical protein HZH66_007065 [Vespula vulgaris]
MAEVAGWGIYDIETSKTSQLLQTITMPIQETEKCKEIFKTLISISDQQICVGGVIGADSCRGDSGGPLMKVETIDELPKYYVIGVVSFGVQDCGATTTPGNLPWKRVYAQSFEFYLKLPGKITGEFNLFLSRTKFNYSKQYYIIESRRKYCQKSSEKKSVKYVNGRRSISQKYDAVVGDTS